MTAVRYRDEVLELIVCFYAEVVGPTFVLMETTHVPVELPSSMTTWRVKGLRVWRGQHICQTLIPLKVFWDALGLLYLHISHLQPLLLR